MPRHTPLILLSTLIVLQLAYAQPVNQPKAEYYVIWGAVFDRELDIHAIDSILKSYGEPVVGYCNNPSFGKCIELEYGRTKVVVFSTHIRCGSWFILNNIKNVIPVRRNWNLVESWYFCLAIEDDGTVLGGGQTVSIYARRNAVCSADAKFLSPGNCKDILERLCAELGVRCDITLIGTVPYIVYVKVNAISSDNSFSLNVPLFNYTKIYGYVLYGAKHYVDYSVCGACPSERTWVLVARPPTIASVFIRFDNNTIYLTDVDRRIGDYDHAFMGPSYIICGTSLPLTTCVVGHFARDEGNKNISEAYIVGNFTREDVQYTYLNAFFYTFPHRTFYSYREPIMMYTLGTTTYQISGGNATVEYSYEPVFMISLIPHKVVCGDNICDYPVENNSACMADCPPWCGDGICTRWKDGEPLENEYNCPQDCPPAPAGQIREVRIPPLPLAVSTIGVVTGGIALGLALKGLLGAEIRIPRPRFIRRPVRRGPRRPPARGRGPPPV